eukprot:349928-Chlamydomonas_euryale.AAC.3
MTSLVAIRRLRWLPWLPMCRYYWPAEDVRDAYLDSFVDAMFRAFGNDLKALQEDEEVQMYGPRSAF